MNKTKLIVSDKEKLADLEKIASDLVVKCAKLYAIREGVILVDEDKNIKEANEVVKVFGVDINNYKDLYSLFDEELKDVIEKFFLKLEKRGFAKQKNLFLKNGLMVDIHAEIINIDGKKYYVVSLKQN